MNIDLLYFSGCPSWKRSKEFLNKIIEEKGLDLKINLVQIETDEEAVLHQFPGSPTIRLEGSDLFPFDQPDYRLGCRIYQTPNGFQGTPTKEMLEEKLDLALKNHSKSE